MPVPEREEQVARHLLRDVAHDALCDAIVRGTLAPGERLHDEELCAWLGLSRTPVRDALARLCDEGLVETAPQKFTRVTPLAPGDARDAFQLLAWVHALATELAVPRMERTHVDDLRAANDTYVAALVRRDPVAAYAADECFHAVFVTHSGNAEVAHTLERLGPRCRRMERLHPGPAPGRRSVAQHEAMIDRAMAGDAAAAASAARENWLALGLVVERSLTVTATSQ